MKLSLTESMLDFAYDMVFKEASYMQVFDERDNGLTLDSGRN